MNGRNPEIVAPHRIEALATLPLFHKLQGRKVVLAGRNDGAVWKAELLAAAGADLHVFAGEAVEKFQSLAKNPPAGRITVVGRTWQPHDLQDAALAVAAVENHAEAEQFAAAARTAGAVVNIIDRPQFCDVQFATIVNRSPLVVAISTDGGAPVFGQAIRQRIEQILPRGLQKWAAAAQAWRPRVAEADLDFPVRRHFWAKFSQLALRRADHAPTEADRAAILQELQQARDNPPEGRIVLVGAGPGDPDLLTIKALRALQQADVILYDDLVSAGVLELARREAKRIAVGKIGHGRSCNQDDINAMLVSFAQQGQYVVRLKGGDPLIFARAAEEIEAANQAGIAIDMIPGISAAQGAAASLGISLSERTIARRIQFITAHDRHGKLPDDIVWAAVADPHVTTIVYMPRKTLAEFRNRAISAGLSPETPAVAIQNATLPDEVRLIAPIAALPETLSELQTQGPVLVMIGAVVRSASS